MTLVEEEATTMLLYTAHASVGGKLAQIGSRLIDSTARKMADDFFARFTQIVGPVEAAAAVAGLRRRRAEGRPAGLSLAAG